MATLRVTTQEARWSGGPAAATLTVQEDGTTLPQRTVLNFGSGIVAADNPTDNRIDISVSGGVAELPDPFETPLSEGNVALSTGSTLIKNANANRSILILTNGSDTGMWIWMAATGATVGSGTYLAPQSSPLVLPYSGAASGLHVGSSGTKTLGVVEF